MAGFLVDLDINDVAVDGASALAGIVLPHAAHEAEGKQQEHEGEG